MKTGLIKLGLSFIPEMIMVLKGLPKLVLSQSLPGTPRRSSAEGTGNIR